MSENIDRKVETGESGLYFSLAFPILFAFVLTFAASRLIGYLITYGYLPEIYLQAAPGLHVHHFTYGVFMLFIAGYLALFRTDAKSKFWIAMLLGLGLGLAMDEFGMWLHLRDDNIIRWEYDGFNIIIGFFLFVLTVKPGVRMLKKLWPRKRQLN